MENTHRRGARSANSLFHSLMLSDSLSLPPLSVSLSLNVNTAHSLPRSTLFLTCLSFSQAVPSNLLSVYQDHLPFSLFFPTVSCCPSVHLCQSVWRLKVSEKCRLTERLASKCDRRVKRQTCMQTHTSSRRNDVRVPAPGPVS